LIALDQIGKMILWLVALLGAHEMTFSGTTRYSRKEENMGYQAKVQLNQEEKL